MSDDIDAGDTGRRRQPLARGMELLTAMIDGDGDAYGVRELSALVGLSPSTAHRLLADLERLGLVARTDQSTYRLGQEFLRLAWATTDRFPLHELSRDVLRALRDSSGETSFFGVYSAQRREMMFTLTVESPHPLRYAIPLREWLPLNAGASGIAILAFLSNPVQQEILRGPLRRATQRTLVNATGLTERLEEVRRAGYALTLGERIEGAVAFAAPVLGPAGVVGVTGISLPESRFDPADESRLGDLVRASAEELTGKIAGGAATVGRAAS